MTVPHPLGYLVTAVENGVRLYHDRRKFVRQHSPLAHHPLAADAHPAQVGRVVADLFARADAVACAAAGAELTGDGGVAVPCPGTDAGVPASRVVSLTHLLDVARAALSCDRVMIDTILPGWITYRRTEEG